MISPVFAFWLFIIKCVCDKIRIICEYGWGLQWVYIVLNFSVFSEFEKYDMKGLETVRKTGRNQKQTYFEKMIKLMEGIEIGWNIMSKDGKTPYLKVASLK